MISPFCSVPIVGVLPIENFILGHHTSLVFLGNQLHMFLSRLGRMFWKAPGSQVTDSLWRSMENIFDL